MKFISIFEARKDEDSVYSVTFTKKELIKCGAQGSDDEADEYYVRMTEFQKLQELWADPKYLCDFYHKNLTCFNTDYWGNITEEEFIRQVFYSANLIFCELNEIFSAGTLNSRLEPLDSGEDSKRSKQKSYKVKSKFGKINGKFAFRIYGIKLDDVFIVTGGAIKIVQKMSDAGNTKIELAKMNLVSQEFCNHGVLDKDSFLEFLILDDYEER